MLNHCMAIVPLKLAKTFTMLLFMQWVFLPLDFKYYRWFLWTLFQCFSISNCMAFMHAISSTNTLMFLFKALKIGENMFIFLCLTFVLSSAIGVIGCFLGANINEKSRIISFNSLEAIDNNLQGLQQVPNFTMLCVLFFVLNLHAP